MNSVKILFSYNRVENAGEREWVFFIRFLPSVTKDRVTVAILRGKLLNVCSVGIYDEEFVKHSWSTQKKHTEIL